ncbi:hypothetical protein GCK72_021304 [Caenorhabditis remanei]|uniref:Tyrosine-protein phosphatase domain-containing protein n=1 Tax=Caenorhabditis remanei TaxID=31234 RepID=A0A6A5GHR4_CAERE|nr:hypothetical protein GCK72_021304 [Caenorhabditis remanei]KAF1754740.1 hypothetical protein GCK72_021304 [Caenorhabditis remanei]
MKATTPEVEEVEVTFDWLNKILAEIDGIGNIKNWKAGKEHFINETKRLEKDGVPMGLLNELKAAGANWIVKFEILSKTDSTPTLQDITEAKNVLEKTKTKMSEFDTSGPFWTFRNFSSAVNGISPVLKAAKGVEVFLTGSTTSITIDAQAKSMYTTYLDSVINKLNTTAGHFADFQTVSKLLAAREQNFHHRKYHLSYGLPNGASDVSSLSADVLNPWILKVIKTTSLKTALDHLIEISAHLKKIDGSFEKNAKGINKLMGFFDPISKILNEADKAKSGIQGFNCSKPTTIPIKLNSFDKFYNNLENIDNKLAVLKNLTDQLSRLAISPGIVQIYDEAIAILNEVAGDDKKVKGVIEKFQSYSQKEVLNDHIVQINGLTDNIGSLKPTSIKEEAKKANENMKALNDYQAKMNGYADYFVCLQNQDKLKSVFKALEGLNRIRNWTTGMTGALTDGINTMTKVNGIKDDLKALQKSIGLLGDLKSKETDALKDFKDAPTISENIGRAVQGLAEMSLALEKRTDVENKFVDIKVVSDNKANVKDSGDLDSLDDLTKLSGSLQKMYTSLNNFDKTVGSFVRSDTFANQSGIFEKAKQVAGVTDDFSRMIVAVGNLKQTAVGGDADKLEEIEDALKTMDSLDLNFTGFHKDFDESKKSLEELDVFFAGFYAKFQPISATVATGQTPPILRGSPTVSIQRPWTSTQRGVKKDSNALLIYGSIAGGVFGVTFIVVLVHVGLHIWCRKWLVYHYCIKWKATPEILFDMFYAYVNNQLMALGDFFEIPENNYGQITYRMYVDLRDLALTRFLNSPDIKQVASIEPSDCRDKMILLEKGRTVLKKWKGRFANSFFHGNEVNMPYGIKLILTEPPQKKSANKNSTLEKFFWVAKQEKTKTIIMFCKLEEEGKIVCDRYYPEKEGETLELDRLTVKCSKLENKFDKTLIVRTLVVKFDTEKEFSLTHYALRDWAIGDYPSVDSLLYLHECIEKDKSRAIIHCDDGCERTGQFALGILFYQKLKKSQKLNFEESFLIIKKARYDSIFKSQEFAFAARFCLEIVATRAKLNDEQKEQYEKLKCGWEDIEIGCVQEKKRIPNKLI